jgi:signal transduction histidine kinase
LGAPAGRGGGRDAHGAVLTLHDLTARRELERQKDELFANVSHDLRTPVAVVKTSVGVVLADEPTGMPEPLHRMLVNADLATDRLAALVDDLLELARVRTGRAQLRRERGDLRGIARRAAGAIEPLARARRQRLEVGLPAEPLEASVDPARLERALLNLLSNAHKHGHDGGVIRLSLSRRGGVAELAVADDGPGVPLGEQARIFDRFYRAGPRRPGGARAPGSACRSPGRSPSCTAAGSRSRARPGRARRSACSCRCPGTDGGAPTPGPPAPMEETR